jgi:hypothetical protein
MLQLGRLSVAHGLCLSLIQFKTFSVAYSFWGCRIFLDLLETGRKNCRKKSDLNLRNLWIDSIGVGR